MKDIVIIKDGSSAGKLGINLTNINFLPGSTTMKIQSKNTSILNKKYLYYFLLTQQTLFRDIIFQGTAIKHIRRDNLKAMKLLLPSLDHQQRIVKILDKFSHVGISAELTKEVTLRKQMMNFYIHKLTNLPQSLKS